jgi:hypothetical protein
VLAQFEAISRAKTMGVPDPFRDYQPTAFVDCQGRIHVAILKCHFPKANGSELRPHSQTRSFGQTVLPLKASVSPDIAEGAASGLDISRACSNRPKGENRTAQAFRPGNHVQRESP